MKPKIAILNAYDFRNKGDRAIIENQIAWIRRLAPDVDIRIFSSCWRSNRQIFGEEMSLPPPVDIYGKGPVKGFLRPIFDYFRSLLDLRSDKSWVEFRSCDAYFLCGGGYLYSSRTPFLSRQLYLHVANSLLAIRQNKPVMQFPQSWGPLTKAADKWICGKLAARLRWVVARGADSKSFVSGLVPKASVKNIPDIVLAARELSPELFNVAGDGAGGLGIAPADYSFARKCNAGDLDDYTEKLYTIALLFWREYGKPVTLFAQVNVLGADDDRPVAVKLEKRLKAAGVPVSIEDGVSWAEYWRKIGGQDVFIGSRMHACIFSLVSNVPTIGLAYQPKFKELFDDLGIDRFVHDVATFDAERVFKDVRGLMDETIEDRDQRRDVIRRRSQEIIEDLSGVAADSGIVKTLQHKTGGRSIHISVVTPSFKQVAHLKCCAASVRDQKGDFQVEHLIHDGGSGEEFDQWAAEQQGAICVSEKDDGMYDAINRGFHEASGDIIAWLNCDEQYFPGALQRVARYFEGHPETDILFGDVVLVDEGMTPLAYRRAVMPSLWHIRYSHLSSFSAATFVRRRVLDEGHYLQTRWKTIADAVWIEELLAAGYRAATLYKPLATFCMLGSNLGQSPLLFQEREVWERELGTTDKRRKLLYVLEYRMERLMAGAYWVRKLSSSSYILGSQERLMQERWLSGRWNPAKNEAARKRILREGALDGMSIRIRHTRWALVHAVLLVSLSIYVDGLMQGDAIKGPSILLFSMMYLSFRTRLRDLILIALVYFITAWYVLSEKTMDVQIVRLVTFTLGSILAIFWSASMRNLENWIHSTVSLIRKMKQPVILVNRQGQVILVNHACCDLLRKGETNLLNRELLLNEVAGDGTVGKCHAIRDWGERPPEDIIVVSMAGGDGFGMQRCRVSMVGSGKNRFYSFALEV
jgi:polysaccharide pyruvyl transferase WcaK-like protein/glycosyltransferase involved in cell wall biosynthesis